ncbi:MAG: CPBP family intramembrane glutamic endopeptidase [Candidatus Bathyarchaeia archaeon]
MFHNTLKKRPKTNDVLFIVILAFFFAIAVINFLTGQMSFLFEQTEIGSSLFSLLTSTFIPIYFIIWGALRIRKYYPKDSLINRITLIKIMFSKSMRLVGLRKPSSREVFYSLMIGIANLDASFVFQSLAVVPIFEELIYRGIYLGMFLQIFGKNKITAVSALIMSSFTFGWIPPTDPLIKTFGALILGIIYLYGYKKNLIPSMCAHLGLNVVGIHFEIGL